MTQFHSIRVSDIELDAEGNYVVSVRMSFTWEVHDWAVIEEPPEPSITFPSDTANIESIRDLWASAAELEPWIIPSIGRTVRLREFLEHKMRNGLRN